MHAIILLLATSGLRISEALHLTSQDVDLKAGVLSIHLSAAIGIRGGLATGRG